MSSFRVKSVTIEGFKAFTTPQSIELGSRHLFIYGENGQGKTSILEAIRWCIWGGQADRRLRSTFYKGDCQAELTLSRSDGLWRLHRRMRPESAESDYTLYDPTGKSRKLEDVLPHLPRISGEGMHIILAEQQARRRAYVNIESFDEVLHAYLGILDDKNLLRKIIEMREEFSEVLETIDREAETLRDDLNQRLGQVTAQLQETLERLGQDEPPTTQETLDRIQQKADELGYQQPLPRGTPRIAVQRLQEHLDAQRQAGAKGDEDELSRLRESSERVNSLWERLNTRRKLESVLDGQSLEGLRSEAQELEEELESGDLLSKITKNAKAYLEATGIHECPLCGEAATNINQRVSERTEKISAERDSILQNHEVISQRLEEAEELGTELLGSHPTDDELARRACTWKEELLSLLTLQNERELTQEVIEQYLSSLNSGIQSIEQQEEDRDRWYEDHKRTIEDLRNEIRYQELREQQERIRHWLEDGFRPFQQSFDGFDDALRALQDIRDAIYHGLCAVIESRVEPLEKSMTQVYTNLTRQRSFDTVRLPLERGETLPELKVKVAASDVPDRLWDYDDVLNGQALAALRLMPYFVFSALRKDDALPLEILMLDDPSQRFDTAHVELLFKQLKTVGGRAQLMVATHEEDRFTQFVTDHFRGEASPVVVRVVDFHRNRGPTLDVSP